MIININSFVLPFLFDVALSFFFSLPVLLWRLHCQCLHFHQHRSQAFQTHLSTHRQQWILNCFLRHLHPHLLHLNHTSFLHCQGLLHFLLPIHLHYQVNNWSMSHQSWMDFCRTACPSFYDFYAIPNQEQTFFDLPRLDTSFLSWY